MTSVTYGIPTAQRDRWEVDPGEKYQHDPDFDGIDKNRKCTDVCMCLFFLLFLCGMFGLAIYAGIRSNIYYLYTPTDHRGMVCGYNNKELDLPGVPKEELIDLTGKPILTWIRVGKKGYARSFCVESCATEGNFVEIFQYEMGHDGYIINGTTKDGPCGDNTKATIYNYSIIGEPPEGKGYFCTYQGFEFAKRCFPTNEALKSEEKEQIELLRNNVSETLKSYTLLYDISQDLIKAGPYIIGFTSTALILGIIWLALLRCSASFFVWFSVLLCFAALGLLTFLCYKQRNDDFHNVENLEAYSFGLYSVELNRKVFNVVFWILVAIDAIFLLCFLFLCDRIKLSVGIIQSTSKVISQVCTLYFVPIFFFIFLLIWWVYVIFVFIVLIGASKPHYEYVEERGTNTVVYEMDTLLNYLSIYHFFGFIWVSIFINDLMEVTVAGVFSAWYFKREPKNENIGKAPIWKSLGRALRYHIGSIAFGSLIIAIIKFIRAILEYIDKKTKDSTASFVKFILKCMKCCFWCLDKVFQYINRNAYVLIAVHGENFWTSCKKAFQLILRNIVRVATLNWVGDFTLFIGRVLITALTTSLSVFTFVKLLKGVRFFFVPSALVAILSFIMSGTFTGLFEIGIDAMFMSFMEDEERNGDGQGEPFAPEELRQFIAA